MDSGPWYGAIPVCCCPIVPLSHCIPISLCPHPIAPLSHCALFHCSPIPMRPCPFTPPSHCAPSHCNPAPLFPHSIKPDHSGELQTQKLNSHLVKTQSLNVLPFKPGVGQYIAIHATLTAREFFFAYFYPSSSFTCIFFQNLSHFFPVLACRIK